MCGIAGILSFTSTAEPSEVQKMTNLLRHRGPDGEGIWLNGDKNLCLGHRRLSIIDVSALGAQPMHYLDRYTITFNGEIYNYPELKESLLKAGYSFKSTSDTEVLLALYDQKREKALQELDGMFAFAIWDRKEKTLFCARDRFGEKPFFYSNTKDKFIFASEMKALLGAGVSNARNLRKIYNYLLYTVLENQYSRSETFFRDISQLEPAHYLLINDKGYVKNEQYWQLPVSRNERLSDDECTSRFQELFSRSVSRRLRSDVPVGSSLSGGLDSSSIVMTIDQLKTHTSVQKTFSARFPGFAKDEGKYMQQVIDRTSAEPHFVYPTVDSVLQNFERLTYHQEEPVGSASVALQYEVMKLARDNGVVVLLDGQGADETLAGYTPYWYTYFCQLYRNDRKKYAVEKSAYRENYGTDPVINDFEFKWRTYSIGTFNGMSDFKRKFISARSDYFVGIHPDIVSTYKNDANPLRKFNSLKEHLRYSTLEKGLGDLLRYADRNSMAHSVEVRLPFLSHELVEFIFSLPEEQLLRNGWTKYLVRKSMSGLLPGTIAWRKDKIGYEPPQAEWLREKAFVDFKESAIETLKKEHVITKTFDGLTWNYITLGAFYRAFE